MAERVRQIVDFGHTPTKDRAAPLGDLIRAVAAAAVVAREDDQFDVAHAVRRRHLVRLGALVLAAIDRLDAGQNHEADDDF